jgi:MFS family permease
MFALGAVTLVDAVDVSILRGVLPLLKEDWRLSDFELGMLSFAFIFVNVFASIPAGWMADRYRRTRIIGLTMLTWSAISAMSAFAVNYANLFASRALLGMGQAVDDPSSTALMADFYPPRLRGRVFSVQQVMTFVGGGIGLGLGGAVGAALGWRWAFLLVGTPGLLIAFVVFRLRDPIRGEADHMDHFGTPPPPAASRANVLSEVGIRTFLRMASREIVKEFRSIFAIRTMRYILIGISVLLFTVAGVGNWLAVFHQRYSGMTLTQATAATGGVLVVGGIVGVLWGGRVADRIFSGGPAGRIVMISSCIITSITLFFVSFNLRWVGVNLALQCLGTLAGAASIPALRASMTDVIPAESRGVGVSAFALTSAVFGTSLAPPIVGALSDATSLRAAFNIVSPIVVVGALILLRARKTIVEDAQAMFQALIARLPAQEPAPGPAG